MKILLVVIFILGIIYLLWPGPKSIHDFPALPESKKSEEPGDTFQNPENSAYFSNHRRGFVTNFYQDNFEHIYFLGLKLPSIRLNHPPEEAFQYIRDQQTSTYLEQFIYPLRESVFVNGYEPFDESGRPFHIGITNIVVSDQFFDSKTTLRFYYSNPLFRVLIYFGIWASAVALFILFKKVLRE